MLNKTLTKIIKLNDIKTCEFETFCRLSTNTNNKNVRVRKKFVVSLIKYINTNNKNIRVKRKL